MEAPLQLEKVFEAVPGAVGLALIITNDYKSNPQYTNLEATKSDGDAMDSALKELGYASVCRHNVTQIWLMSLLRKADRTTYPPSCRRIVFVFAGHGRIESGVTSLIMNDGRDISIQSIVTLLSPSSSASTIGDMVRMFFIDACRGEGVDEGRFVSRGGRLVNERRISSNAGNYLVGFSTLAGFQSYEVRDEGGSCGLWLPRVAEKLTSCDDTINNILVGVNEELMKEFQDEKKYLCMMQPEMQVTLNEMVNLFREKPSHVVVKETVKISSDSGQTLPPPGTSPLLLPSTKLSRTSSSIPCTAPSIPRTSPSIHPEAPPGATGSGSPSRLRSERQRPLLAAVFSHPTPSQVQQPAATSMIQQPSLSSTTTTNSTPPIQSLTQMFETCREEARETQSLPSNIAPPELVQRDAPQVTSGHYQGLLNYYAQTGVIAPSYSSSWDIECSWNDSQNVTKFKATVKCELLKDGSLIVGDSKIFYDGRKGTAKEMAAKDAVEQIERRIKTTASIQDSTIRSMSLPSGGAEGSKTKVQPLLTYKQNLNNHFQGKLNDSLPVYDTKPVESGFQCHITHKRFDSKVICGQVCKTKKEAENSAAWRALVVLGLGKD